MEKITFIALRYGSDVNGGAEVHCRMLAERMISYYEVEVLTSRIKNYKTLEQEYPPGVEIINGVTIRRFPTISFNSELYEQNRTKAKWSRKVRRMIYRMKMSGPIFNAFPIWKWGTKREYAFLKSSHFYSNDILSYLQENHHESKALIFFSYASPFTYFGAQIAPAKSILIPTVHYHEGGFFHSIFTELFAKVGHIAFNSQKERELAKTVFRRGIAPNSVVGVGVDIATPANFKEIQNRYNIPDNYVLYFGRVCHTKMNDLVGYFIRYKKMHKGDVKLVLTGGVFMEKSSHPDIIYTGFVNEHEKTTIIQHAQIVINPSKSESLSLLLLEAMELGKTVLVNGNCPVLKQHSIDSDSAVLYYKNKGSFIRHLNYLLAHPEILIANRQKARKYISQNYDWSIILKRLRAIIERVSK